MLDRFSRGLLCALSALCFIGIFTLSPLRVRSSSGLQRSIAKYSSDAVQPAGDPRLAILRDPFAGEPTAVAQPAPTAATISLPRNDTPTLPGNLPSSTIPSLPQEAAPGASHVTAVVTGSHPYAMLDTAGDHQIKGIGDRVDGRPIVAIDFDGVTLQGGARLRVATGNGTQ